MPKKYVEVLLIDDDADDKEVFEIALNKIDSRIKLITAKNGIGAMELFNGDSYFTPDFIFLDLNMPLMNGRDCLVEIKKLKRFISTPVYIYTTSTDPRDENNLMQAGAVGFITKPFDINNLINILTYLISPKLQILH